jgi:hypothetical protein
MTTEELEGHLFRSTLRLRYAGGSSPGEWRTVTRARLDGQHLVCQSSGSPRRLKVADILEVEAENPPPEPEGYLDSLTD